MDFIESFNNFCVNARSSLFRFFHAERDVQLIKLFLPMNKIENEQSNAMTMLEIVKVY